LGKTPIRVEALDYTYREDALRSRRRVGLGAELAMEEDGYCRSLELTS
jgi:hypothetical protein